MYWLKLANFRFAACLFVKWNATPPPCTLHTCTTLPANGRGSALTAVDTSWHLPPVIGCFCCYGRQGSVYVLAWGGWVGGHNFWHNLYNVDDLFPSQQIVRYISLLLLYLLATSKVILDLWQWTLMVTVPLGNQASQHHDLIYPTQSHYPDTEPSSPCTILIILRT